ncbi:MAG: hypothetical protein RSD81_09210 [Pseudomonas sp.]
MTKRTSPFNREATDIKRFSKSLRFGGTRLYHAYSTEEAPQAEGVRRINSRCVELETFSNLNKEGSTFFIGSSIIVTTIGTTLSFSAIGFEQLTTEIVTTSLLIFPLPPLLGFIFYLLSGNHRSRGSFIRIHRETRKLYYSSPGEKHLHVLDWDQLEVLAGYVPIVTGSVNTSRHPLYLIGVDYNLKQPAEICIACGNLGVIDGDRSAKSLWAYLQHFMAYGPEGLPEPPPLPPRMTRRQATFRRFHEWRHALVNSLATTRGKLWAPIMLPLRVLWLIWDVFPDCLGEFIQYNVPYTSFPRHIDELCGFAEKRKPVIRVNGKIVDDQ